jgi:hypothetical protein
VSGSGTINLADETLSLRLRPLARLADTGITVPLIVSGTIENPKARIDEAHSAQANLVGLAQSARNLAEVPLGVISGALNLSRMNRNFIGSPVSMPKDRGTQLIASLTRGCEAGYRPC